MTQIDYDRRKRESERSDLICYPQSKGKIYDDRTQDGLWQAAVRFMQPAQPSPASHNSAQLRRFTR